MSVKKILITDDHPLLLIGLKGIIENIKGYQLVGAATNGTEALKMASETQPDICFIDLELPGVNGMDVLKQIKKNDKNCKVAILTSHKEEELLISAIESGADGYLLKDFAHTEIEKCLTQFVKSEPYYSSQLRSYLNPAKKKDPAIDKLSRTEKKVLKLISQDKTSKEIGSILFISPKTVDNHRSNIIKKLDITPTTNSLFSWASKNEAHL